LVKTRAETLAALRQQPNVSVLIVGAGINGAGVFRELALQGVNCLLIDKSDFCAGTSAASGRVIHGGIRYLENGEFRLVKEALLERNRLLLNAPHYVKPLRAVMPAFSWLGGWLYAAKQFMGLPSKPGDRGALIIKIGMMLYDAFSGSLRSMPRHCFQGRKSALAQYPPLNPKIRALAAYYDARLTYAERLCYELVADAQAAFPTARALNYVRVHGAAGDTVTLCDQLTDDTLTVKPQIVVNASGAWIDFTNRSLGRETQFIGGTKGSHMVVKHDTLHALTRGDMFHFINTDGRLTIFYPIEDKVLIGTTDLRIDDPDSAVCDEDETDYLLQSVSHIFPAIKLDRSHIVFRFSGMRPLPTNNALVTGQISRDHSFPFTAPNTQVSFPLYSLVGGKWTTFRAFAEQVTDQLLADLRQPRRVDTKRLAIGGGKAYPRTDAERTAWLRKVQQAADMPLRRLDVLLERYGTRAEVVARYMAAAPDEPLRHHPAYTRREIQYIALHEQVAHVDDVILRRTLIGLLGQLTPELLRELTEVLGTALGWSAEQQRAEIERTITLYRQRHGVELDQKRITLF
jgi:glycerol-3-phosphate dehydrogenase